LSKEKVPGELLKNGHTESPHKEVVLDICILKMENWMTGRNRPIFFKNP